MDAHVDGLHASGLISAKLAQVIGATRETPRPERRELVRKWRLSVPMSHFEGIRRQFADAALQVDFGEHRQRGVTRRRLPRDNEVLCHLQD